MCLHYFHACTWPVTVGAVRFCQLRQTRVILVAACCSRACAKNRRPTANLSEEAIKIITQTCKVIKTVYQKYIKTSARVGYAPPVWKRAQVQGLKESRLTIRGTRIGALSHLRRFGQVSSYSPKRLVNQGAMLWERSAQGWRRAKHKTYGPFDDHWVILWRILRRIWPSLVYRLGLLYSPIAFLLRYNGL